MINNSEIAKKWIIREIINQSDEFGIEYNDIEDIVYTVEDLAESRLSEIVDREDILQIVRLFYLVGMLPDKIEWTIHPLDRLGKYFHGYFQSSDPIQVKQLRSDPVIAEKVEKIALNNSNKQMSGILKYLRYRHDNEIPIEAWMLEDMSDQVNAIRKVLDDLSDSVKKAA